jgi:hypothetical protein
MNKKADYIDNQEFNDLILDFFERKKINPSERIPERLRLDVYSNVKKTCIKV